MRGQLWEGTHSDLHLLKNVGQQALGRFQNQFVSNNSKGLKLTRMETTHYGRRHNLYKKNKTKPNLHALSYAWLKTEESPHRTDSSMGARIWTLSGNPGKMPKQDEFVHTNLKRHGGLVASPNAEILLYAENGSPFMAGF